MLLKRISSAAMVVVLALAVAACGGGARNGSSGGSADQRRQLRISVVTHGQAGVEFWTVVKNGVDRAAADEKVNVNYQSPASFDMVAMSRLIDGAVATHPDGLVVSVPDAKALGPSIRRAVAAGIPVITINSGADVFKQLGALVHVGQEEYQAGYAGGQHMAAAGVRHALCLNGEVGNVALDQRCKGFGDALAKSGGASKVVEVKVADPTFTQQATKSALASSHPDGVFSVTSATIVPALAAVKDANQTGKVKLATFDLGEDVLADVRSGAVLFAIDQQEFLQGYLPVVLMSQYLRYGVLPEQGNVIATGPNFVTQRDAAKVIELSKQGLR